MSSLSVTDVKLFNALSNQEVVHMVSSNDDMHTSETRVEEDNESERSGASSGDDSCSASSASDAASNFSRRVSGHLDDGDVKETNRSVGSDASIPPSKITSLRQQIGIVPNAMAPRPPTENAAAPYAAPYASQYTSQYTPPYHNQYAPESFEDKMMKQSLLLDMQNLRASGTQFSRVYTMQDRLEDIELEMKRITMRQDEDNMVSFMKDSMKIGFGVIEMVNGKFKVLELGGWANQMNEDIDKYDNALKKIYRKYWRKSGGVNPEMEIIMGICGAIGMHHFKKKVMGNGMFNGFASRSDLPKATTRPPMPSFIDDEEGLPPDFLPQ